MAERVPYNYLTDLATRQQSDDPVEATVRAIQAQRVARDVERAGDPDTVARVTRVARDEGVAPVLVEDRLDEIEAAQRAQAFTGMLSSSTALWRWAAANPRGAVAASDDTESLGVLGSGWDFLKNLPGRVAGAGGWGLAGQVGGTYNAIQELNDLAMSPLWAGMSALSEASGIEALDPERALRDRERQRAESTAYFREGAERAREANRGGNWVTEGLLTGAESIPLTVGAALTRNPNVAAGAMGAVSAGGEYAKAREAGLDPGTALRYGVTQGGIEAITEKIPAGTLIDMIARKLPWGKAFVRELGQEMTGEQVATALQDLNEWAFLPENRGKTLNDYISERPDAALSTALAVAGGTGTTAVGIGAAQRATDATARVANRIGEARQARAERAAMDELARGAEGSRLRQRDPEAFRSLVRQQAEEAGTGDVFIPGEAVRAFQQSDGYLEREDPFTRYDVDEAAGTGGDIVIPIEDFLTDIVGTQAWNAVRDDVRLTPGGMSTREAQTFGEAMDDVMSAMSDEAAQQDAAQAGERTVREKITDRLAEQFGTSFTAPAARSIAEVAAQRMQTRASRLGQEITEADLEGFEVRQDMGETASDARAYEQRDWARTIDAVVRGDRVGASMISLGNTSPALQVAGLPRAPLTMRRAKVAKARKDHPEVSLDTWRQLPSLVADPRAVFPSPKNDGSVVVAIDAKDADGNPVVVPVLASVLDGNVVLSVYGRNDAYIANGIRAAEKAGKTVYIREGLADSLAVETESRALPPRHALNAPGVPTKPARKILSLRDGVKKLEQEARGRIVFDGTKRIIELFQSRNLSTPLHELSHMWLEELAADASLPGAPDQLKADWETAKRYFAANGHKIGKDGQIPVEAHELWARSGERYLMEGKAPSSALVRLFEQFRAWLVNIYKTVDRLRAPITPEIREVFDRLLATDEEIAAAQERQGLDALFKDAAEAGMSEAEFGAYQRQVDDARAGAHAALIDKTLKAVRRRETERYRDARKSVRAEEQERIDGSPLYKALAGMKDNRISREWIVDNMGEDALGLLPHRIPPLYAEGGADPNVIAEQSGYAGAQDMLEAVIGAERAHRQAREGGDKQSMRERAIETATDEEMNRRWGDPLNDGSIEREALAAVQSDMQGEVIASELRVLSRKTGRRPTPYQLAREWARGKVRAGTVAQEASPAAIQRYARNAAKAGRAAEQAMLSQDVDEAFRQKQFQMLNTALLVSAKEAHDEVTAAVNRMDRTARAKTRKSTDQGYLDQAHALLESVDLKKRSRASVERQGKFEEWAAARQAEGFDVVVPPSFEATLGKTNWSRLSVENLLALDEAVRQVLHLGRLKQTLLDNKERRDFDEVVGEAIGGMDGMRRKPPSDMMEPSRWESVKSKVSAIDAALLKMETVFDWLDRGNSNGAFNRVVFRPIAEAQEQARLKMNDLIGQLNEALGEVPKKTLRRWREKVTTELLNRETGRPFVFTRDQFVSMALNMGNRGNIEKLTGGYGWNEAQVREVLNRELTAEEWAYVQKVWDIVGSQWPEIAAMEKRLNGVEPEKVEPTPVETPHGTFPGGYFPVVYDPRKNYDSEAHQGGDLFENIYTRATTPKGFTKARTDVQRPIHLSLNVITRHVAEVVHDLTHREAVMQADKFLSDKRVMKAVDETLGPEVRKSFRPWLQRIANQWAYDRAGMAGLEGFLRKMRVNATVVGMGYRITTAMVQAAGYMNSFETVGARWVAPRMKDAANPDAWKFVLEHSKEVAGRMSSLDRDVNDAARKAAGGGKLNAATRFAFHGIGFMDRVVTIPTWLGAYDKAQAQGMSEGDAVYAADKAVRQSQGAGSAKDLAAIQAGRGVAGELGKYLTMFYSFMSAFYQRQRTLGRNVRDARPRDIPRLMARAWWMIIAAPLLSEILAGRGPGDDDDDETWASWALQAVGGQFMGPIPIARDLVPVLVREFKDQPSFGYRFTPAQGGVEALVRLAKNAEKVYEGDEPKDGTRNLIETAGYLTGSGLGAGQIAAATQFLVDVGSGDADPEGFADWWEGLTKGRIKDD